MQQLTTSIQPHFSRNHVSKLSTQARLDLKFFDKFSPCLQTHFLEDLTVTLSVFTTTCRIFMTVVEVCATQGFVPFERFNELIAD